MVTLIPVWKWHDLEEELKIGLPRPLHRAPRHFPKSRGKKATVSAQIATRGYVATRVRNCL